MMQMKRGAPAGAVAKIDIRAVAAHARVSIATVSRAINRSPTVDPALAARVWKSVSELNYFPNTQARALVSGKSRMIGLIISEITNPFFPELIQEFERIAVAHGYEILVGSTNYELARMELCARRMLERKVDGIAMMTFGFEEAILDRFAVEDIPVVFIDVPPKNKRSSTLNVDYRAGIYEGVQHLAVLGHRRIAFISGPLQLGPSSARSAAFEDSMRATGLLIKRDWMIEGDHTLDGGRDAMVKLLALDEWPTAVMCSNDMTAIGVQHALFEANLKVPADFSLIGFDDVHLAAYTIPPLTTVRMSCHEIAQAAVTSLLASIRTANPEQGNQSRIATRLIVRQTTGLPTGALTDVKRKPLRVARKAQAG